MKTKDKKTNELVNVSEAGLLSLVAAKLKGRVLFPRRIEEAKKFLQKAKIVKT